MNYLSRLKGMIFTESGQVKGDAIKAPPVRIFSPKAEPIQGVNKLSITEEDYWGLESQLRWYASWVCVVENARFYKAQVHQVRTEMQVEALQCIARLFLIFSLHDDNTMKVLSPLRLSVPTCLQDMLGPAKRV